MEIRENRPNISNEIRKSDFIKGTKIKIYIQSKRQAIAYTAFHITAAYALQLVETVDKCMPKGSCNRFKADSD